MRLSFDIDKMEMAPIIHQPEKEGKGWSYSFVYYLRNLKDIYLLLCECGGISNMKDLLTLCDSYNVQTESGKEWNERYLLEFVNALKNFSLLDTNNTPLRGDLFNSEINAPLTIQDRRVFLDIYSSYFRFREFHNLFGELSDVAHSKVIYAYMDDCRFYNRFVCAEESKLFYIENNHQEIMRFWDVYTKWGTTLQVLNKCPLSALDISLENEELRNAYLFSLSVPVPENFSILDYLRDEMNEQYVYIPELERDLIFKFRFSIDSIKERLVFETYERSNEYRLQRTSEMLVNNNTKVLLPYIENVYMSHIIKL